MITLEGYSVKVGIFPDRLEQVTRAQAVGRKKPPPQKTPCQRLGTLSLGPGLSLESPVDLVGKLPYGNLCHDVSPEWLIKMIAFIQNAIKWLGSHCSM